MTFDNGSPSNYKLFSRMELGESSSPVHKFSDDRSDSGISSLRSGSGDERSGSRSSALSSSDEPAHLSQSHPAYRSSPSFVSSNQTFIPPLSGSGEQVRVWQDSNYLESELHVRRTHAVQNSSFLMSHQSTPATTGPPSTSAATIPSLYPPPHPSLIGPQSLAPHSHLSALPIYQSHLSDIIWKQRFPSLPATHIITSPASQVASDEIFERERAAVLQERDRLMR